MTDLNGTDAGRDHAVTYTEDTAGVFVATSNASLDNQAVNIKTITLALNTAPDAAAEKLFISDALVTFLSGRGMTIADNNSYEQWVEDGKLETCSWRCAQCSTSTARKTRTRSTAK